MLVMLRLRLLQRLLVVEITHRYILILLLTHALVSRKTIKLPYLLLVTIFV
jgi:hypothetical protein